MAAVILNARDCNFESEFHWLTHGLQCVHAELHGLTIGSVGLTGPNGITLEVFAPGSNVHMFEYVNLFINYMIEFIPRMCHPHTYTKYSTYMTYEYNISFAANQ